MSETWWLKVKRAQKHMVDIDREIARYSDTHPYEFTRVRGPRGEDVSRSIQHRVRITAQPDPMLSVMLGDFIHNLRSALDHVIVACVPKRERSNATSFPIRFVDLLEKDGSGEFVVKDAEARENFQRSLRGLAPGARAVVIANQPYHLGPDAHRWILGILSRLENADKHRELITVGGGVRNIVADLSWGDFKGRVDHRWVEDDSFAKDDTIIGYELPAEVARAPVPIVASEVEMHFSGTTVVLIKVTGVRGNEVPSDFGIRTTMLDSIQHVRRVLRALEPFRV